MVWHNVTWYVDNTAHWCRFDAHRWRHYIYEVLTKHDSCNLFTSLDSCRTCVEPQIFLCVRYFWHQTAQYHTTVHIQYISSSETFFPSFYSPNNNFFKFISCFIFPASYKVLFRKSRPVMIIDTSHRKEVWSLESDDQPR